jgi:trehalose utilization protein
MIRVTVWNEFQHEKTNPTCMKLYPKGMHEQIASHLRTEKDLAVRTATLDEPEHGLTKEVLADTDVLIWWGHMAHDRVQDEIVDRVQARILEGMGLIVLHSGHYSKIFRRMMGTTCLLRWREAAEKERLWVVNPSHPIAAGLGPYIELPNTEMYGEHFDIPQPDELVFISWFEGGEVFRSGATWVRGRGKIFYFRPGHEVYPIFHNAEVLKVITNGVRWAAFTGNNTVGKFYGAMIGEPIEKIAPKNYDAAAIDHPSLKKKNKK